MKGGPGDAAEVNVDEIGFGVTLGAMMLFIAAVGVTAHYRREKRRADLLRNLDHHEWWQRSERDRQAALRKQGIHKQ